MLLYFEMDDGVYSADIDLSGEHVGAGCTAPSGRQAGRGNASRGDTADVTHGKKMQQAPAHETAGPGDEHVHQLCFTCAVRASVSSQSANFGYVRSRSKTATASRRAACRMDSRRRRSVARQVMAAASELPSPAT